MRYNIYTLLRSLLEAKYDARKNQRHLVLIRSLVLESFYEWCNVERSRDSMRILFTSAISGNQFIGAATRESDLSKYNVYIRAK